MRQRCTNVRGRGGRQNGVTGPCALVSRRRVPGNVTGRSESLRKPLHSDPEPSVDQRLLRCLLPKYRCKSQRTRPSRSFAVQTKPSCKGPQYQCRRMAVSVEKAQGQTVLQSGPVHCRTPCKNVAQNRFGRSVRQIIGHRHVEVEHAVNQCNNGERVVGERARQLYVEAFA